MAQPKINGSIGPILKPLSVSFDPVRGLNIRAHWESAGSGVVGLMSGLMSSKTAFEAEVGTHRSRLSAVLTGGGGGTGYPDVAQDHWQLQVNENREDIKLHPGFIFLDTLQAKTTDKVLKAVDDYNADKTKVANFSSITNLVAADLAQQFYFVMTHGETHFGLGQPVLHWTTTVSFNSTEYRNDGARELIYTTSQVLAEANPPLGIASQMTSYSPPNIPPNFMWGWRKLPSTRTTVAGNRIEISTEYWLGLYATCVYIPA